MTVPKKVYVKQDYGFVGWRGQNIRLSAGDEYDLDAGIVQDLPDLFTAEAPKADEAETPETPKRRGRRG